MADATEIVLDLHVDARGLRARMHGAGYLASRVALGFIHGIRAVDTPDVVDARDTAYTLADAARGEVDPRPAPPSPDSPSAAAPATG